MEITRPFAQKLRNNPDMPPSLLDALLLVEEMCAMHLAKDDTGCALAASLIAKSPATVNSVLAVTIGLLCDIEEAFSRARLSLATLEGDAPDVLERLESVVADQMGKARPSE